MARNQSYIIVSDVIGSRNYNGSVVKAGLASLIQATSVKFGKSILSPLTVTLGDEYQGVVRSLHTALEIIFFQERLRLTLDEPIELRFAIHDGPIETEVNEEMAWGMLGPGLTKARELLEIAKSEKRRVWVDIKNKKRSKNLRLAFEVWQGIIAGWSDKDYQFVADFINLGDYKLVAEKWDKNPDQTWKREKTLMIREYLALKELILLL